MDELNIENDGLDNLDNEKEDQENKVVKDKHQVKNVDSNHNNEQQYEPENINESNDDSKGIKLPENIEWRKVLIWGISGLVFAIFMVFIVSIFSGTLGFVVGRLFLFGIIFFIVFAGLRLLLQTVSPSIFEEDTEDSSHNDIISHEDFDKTDVGTHIDTSIDDKIDTDPLWNDEGKEHNEEDIHESDNKKMKAKYGQNTDYIKVDGSDIVFPNNAELMAEGIKTMMNKDEE